MLNCPSCGCDLTQSMAQYEQKPGIGWYFLGFFIPIVGIILYFVWKNDHPMRAKNLLYAALAGIIFNMVTSLMNGNRAALIGLVGGGPLGSSLLNLAG